MSVLKFNNPLAFITFPDLIIESYTFNGLRVIRCRIGLTHHQCEAATLSSCCFDMEFETAKSSFMTLMNEMALLN